MAQVRIKLANGHTINAPAEVWIWAIFEALSDAQATKAAMKIMHLAKENPFKMQQIVDSLAPGGKAKVELN